jgi:glucose-1-phosphatase
MIRTMIFDIGNVLVYFNFEQMCQQIATVCGMDLEQVRNEILRIGIFYEKGEMSTEEVHAYFSRFAAKTYTKQEFLSALTGIFQPNESIYPIVKALKNKGLRLLLLSNTCEAHYEYIIRNYSIFSYFDHPILSYEIKARKPERDIFAAALSAAHCHPHECFYTDDMMEYVEAGRAMGIDAELYTDSPTLLQHLERRGLMTKGT